MFLLSTLTLVQFYLNFSPPPLSDSFLSPSCSNNNDANFSVTWLKDGKAIPETSSRYHFSSDGNTSFEFGIKACTATDVGQYSARAIGQKGETNAAFALNVTNPGEL